MMSQSNKGPQIHCLPIVLENNGIPRKTKIIDYNFSSWSTTYDLKISLNRFTLQSSNLPTKFRIQFWKIHKPIAISISNPNCHFECHNVLRRRYHLELMNMHNDIPISQYWSAEDLQVNSESIHLIMEIVRESE